MNTTKGHPKGLYLLFVTEMWERFSFYGMRALFILYMVKALMYNKELASEIYGNYLGMVYLTPLLGGYIADRYWGNRRSVVVGALVMALGQFLMFLSACYYTNAMVAQTLMFSGLVALILGNGFFKPNISTLVGDLYEPTDSRKDAAFTIFYMGINLGAFIAPLWCGLVGDTGNPGDFRWGFLSACFGMLIGAAVFQMLKNKYLHTPAGVAVGMPPVREVTKTKNAEKEPIEWKRITIAVVSLVALFFAFSINWDAFNDSSISPFANADWIGGLIYSCAIVLSIFIVTDKSLTKAEQRRIAVIYISAFFVIFFWAAFEQAGASLTYFADEQTDRTLFGWEMPASYFQSFNAIFVVTLAPLFAMMWSFLGKRKLEPSSPFKQSIGLFLLSLGYLLIAFGVKGVEGDTKVSMIWLASLYFTHTMGELCLSPIGLSMVNQLSPLRFSSLLMGVWFLSNAAANKLAGVLSSYYPENGVSKSFVGFEIGNLSQFFMLFVVMSGVAAIFLFLLSSKLTKMMKQD